MSRSLRCRRALTWANSRSRSTRANSRKAICCSTCCHRATQDAASGGSVCSLSGGRSCAPSMPARCQDPVGSASEQSRIASAPTLSGPRDGAQFGQPLPRQADDQRVELFVGERQGDARCRCGRDPREAAQVEPPCSAPHTEAVVHKQLDASAAGVGEQIAVWPVRRRRPEPRERAADRLRSACREARLRATSLRCGCHPKKKTTTLIRMQMILVTINYRHPHLVPVVSGDETKK